MEPQLQTLQAIQDNVKFIQEKSDSSRRVSQITLHLSDSRSNSCPDVNDDLQTTKSRKGSRPDSGNAVRMRQRRSSDDFDLMPDVKVSSIILKILRRVFLTTFFQRRSIIAQHLSDSLNTGDRRHSWHESEQNLTEDFSDNAAFIPRSRSYEHIGNAFSLLFIFNIFVY